MPGHRPFHVIGGRTIRTLLHARHSDIVRLIGETYQLHHAGRTSNPDSYFLRFPDKPTARIIALPARVQGERDVAGIKWISSFPENRARGLERASAAILLNDMATGFPYACLEASAISAARTAASATLAAELLHQDKQAATLSVIGAGPIAATVVDFLLGTGWIVGRFRVHDLVAARADEFSARLRERGCAADAAATAQDAIGGADLVLFATTSAQPYLEDSALFTPAQTVLHVSLRDLGVPVILSAQNVVDDIEHCLKAQTSPHLAEQATGGRAFVAGTIGDLLTGRLQPDRERVRIFSPFGLGVLDLALARFVYEAAIAGGTATVIDDFFAAE
jgi:N-[(2S)-2-amino-2-carboxyethyl]-L-glutamate dehydrogenase